MSIFEHQAPRAVPAKCLIKKCGEDTASRGLCHSCYSTAKSMIKLGKVSESDLLSRGMILPSKQKKNSLFKEQFFA